MKSIQSCLNNNIKTNNSVKSTKAQAVVTNKQKTNNPTSRANKNVNKIKKKQEPFVKSCSVLPLTSTGTTCSKSLSAMSDMLFSCKLN